MAIYWVDPYIEADIGGIHGTTDTVSRSGTYAAPWAITDIIGSSATDTNSKIYGLSNGDEVRLKGLAMSSYLIDAGTFYATSTTAYARKSGETAPSAWSSARSARAASARNWVTIFNKTHTDTFAVADSDGNKPYFAVQIYDQNTDDVLQVHSYIPFTKLAHRFISPYNDSSATTLNMQIIDWRYYITGTTLPTGNLYFACSNSVGVKITDGWTSETVRDGVTCLIFSPSNYNTWRDIYFNHKSNSSTGPDTLYDLKNTILVYMPDANNTYPYAFFYFASATGGYYSGNSYTQRFGTVSRISPGWPSEDWTRYYYYSGVGSTDSSAVNNVEFGMVCGYYGVYSYINSNHGDGTTTTRYNNAMSASEAFSGSVSGSGDVNLTVGTVLSGNSRVLALTLPTGQAITLLNNSYYACYQSFVEFSPTKNFSFPSNLYGPSNSSDIYVSSTGGPYFMSTLGGAAYSWGANLLLQQDVNLVSPNWWEKVGIDTYTGSTSLSRNTQANYPINRLVCGGSDYRSTNPGFLVKAGTYLYYGSSTTAYDFNIHFSTNDYDDIPVGAAFSTDDNNTYHTPMLYFNDSTKSDALCFIKPDVTGEHDYKKAITIPCDPYSSGNTVTIDFNVETTSTFTDYVFFYVYYVNSSGDIATVNTSFNSAITTPTDRTITLSSVGTSHANHMIVEIRIDTNTGQGVSGNGEKLWIHDITATVT